MSLCFLPLYRELCASVYNFSCVLMHMCAIDGNLIVDARGLMLKKGICDNEADQWHHLTDPRVRWAGMRHECSSLPAPLYTPREYVYYSYSYYNGEDWNGEILEVLWIGHMFPVDLFVYCNTCLLAI